VNPDKVVMHVVDRQRCQVILDLFRERIVEPRKATVINGPVSQRCPGRSVRLDFRLSVSGGNRKKPIDEPDHVNIAHASTTILIVRNELSIDRRYTDADGSAVTDCASRTGETRARAAANS
jgi:hypothetical protein